MLEEDDFDLILMDVEMPEMDGLETTRVIREREAESGQHIPIIAMSAHLEHRMLSQTESHGFNCVLMKPFSRTELIAHVQRILGPANREDPDDRIQALERKVCSALSDDS